MSNDDNKQWRRSRGWYWVDDAPNKKYRGESIFLFKYEYLPGKNRPPPQKKKK